MRNFLVIDERLKGILLLLLAVFFFSTMDAVAKDLLSRYPPIQVVWARFTSQAIVSLIIFSSQILIIFRSDNLMVHILRSCLLFATTICFFYALTFMQLSQVTAIFQTAPLIIVFLSALFLGEKVQVKQWLCVCSGMFGAILIIRPDLPVFSITMILPVGASICFAIFSILTRKLGQEKSPYTSFLYTALIGAVISSCLVYPSWVPVIMEDIVTFCFFGLLGGAGHFLLILAYRRSQASILAPFIYSSLIFSLFWGIFLLREFPSFTTIMGGGIIVTSGIFMLITKPRELEKFSKAN